MIHLYDVYIGRREHNIELWSTYKYYTLTAYRLYSIYVNTYNTYI